jgi:succinate dehydrogenase hydrophobic anchor subunit
VAALGATVYVLGAAVGLSVLRFDRVAYARLHDLLGGAPARAGLCAVVVASVYHAFDGLRVALAELFPRTAGWSEPLQALTVFATAAAGIPASVVILWPVVGGSVP